MATLGGVADAAELTGELTRVDVAGTVLDPITPAVERLPGERVKVLQHEFSINFDEFQNMTKREIWDSYIFQIVRRVVIEARRLENNIGRKLVFRRFAVPAETASRRVLTFDQNGVFIGLVLFRTDHFIGKRRDQTDRFNPVVEFIIRAELALAPDDNDQIE